MYSNIGKINKNYLPFSVFCTMCQKFIYLLTYAIKINILYYGKEITKVREINGKREMKNWLKVVITVVCLVVVLVVAKETVSASSESRAVCKEEQTEVKPAEVENGDTFTYRLIVAKMSYLSYCKGHDGDYTLEYCVNKGEKHTVVMRKIGFELFNCQPTVIGRYHDIENVKVGDVIDYTYSYLNTYFQEKEPSVVSGSAIVDGPYVPEENQ